MTNRKMAGQRSRKIESVRGRGGREVGSGKMQKRRRERNWKSDEIGDGADFCLVQFLKHYNYTCHCVAEGSGPAGSGSPHMER